MGIYFIAAGNSSKNRYKTLEKSYTVKEICQFLSPKDGDELKKFFLEGKGVYLWGANDKNLSDLSKLKAGEYVIDVKNKEVIQIFSFCFFTQTNNTRLKEYVGWDREKPIEKRRSHQYVYFLKSPKPTIRKDKKYFQNAFNLNANPQWLVGQKYFTESEVQLALAITASVSVEDFIGIRPNGIKYPKPEQPPISRPDIILRPKPQAAVTIPSFDIPDWLKNLVGKVTALKNDPGHLERDHEDLVASLFELIGYERIHDIKFRRGNIDIRIDKDTTSWITVEVKSDWGLSPDSRGALSQAYNYAHEKGTPFVIITNGDKYCIYDRRQGMSYEENLIANITISKIDQAGVIALNSLRKENIK